MVWSLILESAVVPEDQAGDRLLRDLRDGAANDQTHLLGGGDVRHGLLEPPGNAEPADRGTAGMAAGLGQPQQFRERDRETQTDRQAGRQAGRQTDRERQRETERDTDREREGGREGERGRQTDRERDREFWHLLELCVESGPTLLCSNRNSLL